MVCDSKAEKYARPSKTRKFEAVSHIGAFSLDFSEDEKLCDRQKHHAYCSILYFRVESEPMSQSGQALRGDLVPFLL